MPLLVTSVLPFLAHNHPAAAAFLTCLHHNFHASIIPEFLSDEDRVVHFVCARQQNELEPDRGKQCRNLDNLFVQTPLMQFSPSLMVCQNDGAESILKPLLATKYFCRTLQRCTVESDDLSNDLLQALSKVQSLTNLDLAWSKVGNEHMEIIINSFPSLEMLTIENAEQLKTVDPTTAINISSPLPHATKTLRSLELDGVDALFATQFIPHFSNLRKLELIGEADNDNALDLLPLSSSLRLLKDLFLEEFTLKSTDSLKNLVHLSTLRFTRCKEFELSFLTQENSLPELTTLWVDLCEELSTSSFASLVHAPNLQVLEVMSKRFDNDCLQYLEDMVHLRKLDLSRAKIVGDSRSLKSLMQNLFQLQELNLSGCFVGNQGATAGALYSTLSRLRVLNLSCCFVIVDDLNGIGALKNTLEVLELEGNWDLTSEGLAHCQDLVKLKTLNLRGCSRINDLSPLKDGLNLEDLDVEFCPGLVDDSFKFISEEPNSFPNLRVLDLSHCSKLTEKTFEHLSKNNHLVYQLKKLNVVGLSKILTSSETARNNLCQLKGLQRLYGILSDDDCSSLDSDENELARELMRRLTNLEGVD